MKRLYLVILLAVGFNLTGCIKNEEVVFKRNSQVEFDAAVWNAKSSLGNYPLLTRKPAYGRALVTSGTSADPLLTRASGNITLRVNLIGPVRPTDTELTYEIVPSLTTAMPTVHYAPVTGKYTIPANSSFGEITLRILNPLTSSATATNIGLQLISSPEIFAAENYKVIVLSISQQ